MAKKKKRFEYEKALQELHEIQQNLENGKVPLGEMQEQVEKAANLIKQCKAALRSTEEELQELLENPKE